MIINLETGNFVTSLYREIVGMKLAIVVCFRNIEILIYYNTPCSDYSRETGGDFSELRACPAICATKTPWDCVTLIQSTRRWRSDAQLL